MTKNLFLLTALLTLAPALGVASDTHAPCVGADCSGRVVPVGGSLPTRVVVREAPVQPPARQESPRPQALPESATLVLIGIGLLGLGAAARRHVAKGNL